MREDRNAQILRDTFEQKKGGHSGWVCFAQVLALCMENIGNRNVQTGDTAQLPVQLPTTSSVNA